MGVPLFGPKPLGSINPNFGDFYNSLGTRVLYIGDKHWPGTLTALWEFTIPL